MVICYSLLTNHCAVKSAFCLPQPWKQLQSACISAVIALHISWQRFVDGEIEKQIYFSQSMKRTGRSFKSVQTQLPRSHTISSLFRLHMIVNIVEWIVILIHLEITQNKKVFPVVLFSLSQSCFQQTGHLFVDTLKLKRNLSVCVQCSVMW